MKKPNILVFMTDQQRADTVFPTERAITPHIRRLAEDGVTFASAYTIAPHCCPSRATFFSGLYPSEHGVWNNVGVGNTLSKGLYEGVQLFPEVLKEQGYENSFFGKWHVSDIERPIDRGFDFMGEVTCVPEVQKPYCHEQPTTREWSGYEQLTNTPHQEGAIHRPGYPEYVHYGKSDNPFGDEDVLASAIETIYQRAEKHKTDSEKQPWFQFVGPLGPHDPYCVPQKYLDMYRIEDMELPESFEDLMEDKPALYRRTRDMFAKLSIEEQKEALRHYLAFCSYEDDLLGRVIHALEETGEKENTIIIYLSDHGDYCGEHQLWCKGLPCFDSAYHIPAIVSWPQGIQNPGRVVDDLITIADFTPTILELAGITTEKKYSGYSLVPYLQEQPVQFVQNYTYTQTNGNELYGIQRSIRSKKWKYVFNGFDYDELYDLEKDPLQMHNVIDQYKESVVVKELCKELWRFAKDHQDVCINPYIMVGIAPYGPGIIYE